MVLKQESSKNVANEEKIDVKVLHEAHLALVLLLDTSSSMTSSMPVLNKAIQQLAEALQNDENARRTVDIAVVQFDSKASVVQEFVSITEFEPPTLTASGCTAMGAGINTAIDMVKERCRYYYKLGCGVHRPWIFMITDGAPTDDISSAISRIQEEEGKAAYGKLKFWSVGVAPHYDKNTLFKFGERVIEVDGTNNSFTGLFNWLGKSMSLISVSQVDEKVEFADLPQGVRVVPSHW